MRMTVNGLRGVLRQLPFWSLVAENRGGFWPQDPAAVMSFPGPDVLKNRAYPLFLPVIPKT